MQAHVSLSTIAEESKSMDTTPSRGTTSSRRSYTCSISSEEGSISDHGKLRFELPPLPDPIPSREKKHLSIALRGTSREMLVPHVYSRTFSMQEDLMFQLIAARQPLFSKVLNEPTADTNAPSILITGFGLRNLESLQEVLRAEEHKKLQRIYHAQEEESDSSSSSLLIKSDSMSQSLQDSPSNRGNDWETQTNITSTYKSSQYKKLSYLMNLPECEEEVASETKSRSAQVETEQEVNAGTTSAVKEAQTYLRIHKIFEFFQFIISHLLSALPGKPITFILELLDKCLVYRAGLIEPPVLFNRNHLECLFNMMDKIGTGYIDLQQYKTGMRTVGICAFIEMPLTTHDGLIRKEDFIEDAYLNVIQALDDLLRRHWIRIDPPVNLSESPSTSRVSQSMRVSTVRTSTISESGSARFTKNLHFLDCT